MENNPQINIKSIEPVIHSPSKNRIDIIKVTQIALNWYLCDFLSLVE